MRRGGGSARRWTPHFYKLSFRGAKRRGNPFSSMRECGAWGVRIATGISCPRNDRFWGCGACRRRGEGTPPYGETYKVCVGAAAPPDDGHRIFINCHSEERSDVGIRFLLCGSAARGEYGLPRAFHALAMTGFGGAGRSRRRGDVGIVLRIGGGRRTAGQFTLFSYFFLLQNL